MPISFLLYPQVKCTTKINRKYGKEDVFLQPAGKGPFFSSACDGIMPRSVIR